MILAEPVGEAGHGVEPGPVDGEGAHAVKSRGFAIEGVGGCPRGDREAACAGATGSRGDR